MRVRDLPMPEPETEGVKLGVSALTVTEWVGVKVGEGVTDRV